MYIQFYEHIHYLYPYLQLCTDQTLLLWLHQMHRCLKQGVEMLTLAPRRMPSVNPSNWDAVENMRNLFRMPAAVVTRAGCWTACPAHLCLTSLSRVFNGMTSSTSVSKLLPIWLHHPPHRFQWRQNWKLTSDFILLTLSLVLLTSKSFILALGNCYSIYVQTYSWRLKVDVFVQYGQP